MELFKKWIKSEIDVEIYTCVWAISMVFIYGFELFIYGENAVKFVIIFQMFVFSYAVAWFQKILFLKEKTHTGVKFMLLAGAWTVVPLLGTWLLGIICGWFSNYPSWIQVVFFIVMAITYMGIWIVLQLQNRLETKELNKLLEDVKQTESTINKNKNKGE